MFFVSFGLLILAAVSVAMPAPPSDVKLWTGEEALTAGLLKVIPASPEGLASMIYSVDIALGPSPRGVYSNGIFLWNSSFPGGAPNPVTGYQPGTFAQTFFFCVDFTTRDTFFNDQAGSFFVATDTSCNLYINGGCSGTAMLDVPRGNFFTLTGAFNKSITSFACEWQP
ncbi:hypothetical protein DFH08DRAFT_176719 [Mycena albidolilacea]|uniref:Uncharacterized protein n=1 Tax=Mycena albidolilacea TaxID=1033008 RepID=A0AAD7ASM1_9AGAR|nr:hypothetical protein DFH08DRAFT_176719 [Mycena albidolilacea]